MPPAQVTHWEGGAAGGGGGAGREEGKAHPTNVSTGGGAGGCVGVGVEGGPSAEESIEVPALDGRRTEVKRTECL